MGLFRHDRQWTVILAAKMWDGPAERRSVTLDAPTADAAERRALAGGFRGGDVRSVSVLQIIPQGVPRGDRAWSDW